MKMKYFYIFVFCSTLFYAQKDNSTFEKILEEIKATYYMKNFPSTLDLIGTLNRHVINEEKKQEQQLSIISKDFEKGLKTIKSPLVFNIGKKKIKVHFGENIIYVIKKRYISEYSKLFIEPLPVEIYGKLAIENRFFEIKNETKTVYFSTSDSTIGKISSGGYLTLFGPGDFYVNIRIDGNFKKIPLRVIQVPLEDGTDQKQIIMKFGIPQKKTKKFLDFNEFKTIDGISYYVDDIYGESIEHWIYNKYPSAVFRFDVLGLKDIVQPKWDGLRTIMFTLEQD